MPTLISKDGTSIAWFVEGHGVPLVLVDGALCHSKAGAAPLMLPVLRQHYAVYAYDRRGRGESGDAPSWHLQAEIDDLAAVCAQCPEPPIVCGFSSGAALALYAAAGGLRARQLVLCEPPFVAVDADAVMPPPDAMQTLQRLIDSGNNKGAVNYFMRRIFGMPSPVIWLMNLLMRKQMRKSWAIAPTLLYDIAILETTRFSPPAAIASSIRTPTAVVYGARTAPKLAKAASALAGMIPGAKLRSLPTSSHMIKAKELLVVLQDE